MKEHIKHAKEIAYWWLIKFTEDSKFNYLLIQLNANYKNKYLNMNIKNMYIKQRKTN